MRVVARRSLARVGKRIQKRPIVEQPLLTRTQAAALLEERTQKHLGISAAEFERRLAAGDLPDTSTVRGLAFLVGEAPVR